MQESEAIVGPGAAILSLGDTEEIEAVGEFLSQDAVRISAGARAFVEDWGGPPLAARVERVEPFARLRVSALGVEEQRANIIARFDDAATAAARLGHGYRVNLRVVVSSEDDALRVPIEALVRDAQGWSVFRIENAHARRVRVELGEANGAFRPVASGLSEGDVVVMFPPPGLEEGGRVKIS
jgi:HlyD family secretion protein